MRKEDDNESKVGRPGEGRDDKYRNSVTMRGGEDGECKGRAELEMGRRREKGERKREQGE